MGESRGIWEGKKKGKEKEEAGEEEGGEKKRVASEKDFFWGGPKLWRNTGLQAGKRVEMSVSSWVEEEFEASVQVSFLHILHTSFQFALLYFLLISVPAWCLLYG